MVGWVAAQLFASLIAGAILLAGDWEFVSPARPGGFLGRAAAQLEAGEPLEDTAAPLLVTMLGQLPLWVFLLGVPWLMAMAMGQARPGWRISFTAGDIPRGVLTGLLLQIPLIPIVYVIIQLIVGELAPSARAFSLVDRIDGTLDVVVLYLFVAVGAPVVEELFYRGLVQRALSDRFGATAGVIVASVIFGLVHLSLVELPALIVVGAALGILYQRTGRLGAPIIAHATFNAFTLTVLLAAGGAF